MQEIVHWLLGLEQMAEEIYQKASALFKEDKAFHDFLIHLAEDEAFHYQTLEQASAVLQLHRILPPISLDDQTKIKNENPMKETLENLSSGNLSKDSLISAIMTIEGSEINDLFIFVMQSLSQIDRQFISPAAKIQNHLRYIENFFETIPEGKKYFETIRTLPEIWKEKILIVEDEPSIAGLLAVLLNREGTVEIAENGLEGLNKVKQAYYQLIISDMNMPIMNGKNFYEEASMMFPEIGKRFLFFTGNLTPDHKAFFSDHKLPYMVKPAPLNLMRQKIMEVMYNFMDQGRPIVESCNHTLA